MNWYHLIFTVILIGVLSYLFGFWESPAHSLEYPPAVKFIIVVIGFAVITGCIYLCFAAWHLAIGTYIFK